MVGVVRTVEYNEAQNQSLLHFECTHIETSMRNEVLKFVYNMMPENEKEVMEALEQTEDDEKAEEAVTDANGEAAKEADGNNSESTETDKSEKSEGDAIAQDISAANGKDNAATESPAASSENTSGKITDSNDNIPNKADEINVF